MTTTIFNLFSADIMQHEKLLRRIRLLYGNEFDSWAKVVEVIREEFDAEELEQFSEIAWAVTYYLTTPELVKRMKC